MSVNFDEVLAGALGFYWTDAADIDDDSKVRRGYLRRVDNYVEIETLIEDVGERRFMQETEVPDLLVGAMGAGSALVPEVIGVGWKHNWGGGRSSSETFRANSLLFGIGDLTGLRSGQVLEVSARFPVALTWAGLQLEDSKVKTDSLNRVQEVSINLRRVDDPPRGRLGDGLTLALRGHWEAPGGGSFGRPRQIITALEIACRSTAPRSLSDLVRPLVEAQNLLCLALDGWVEAVPGRAVIDSRDQDAFPLFWNGRMMVTPANAGTIAKPHSPFFSLNDLGGTRGLARWVRLCVDHPRAVEPLTALLRSGGRTREEYLRSVSAAIEYWVTANKATWGKGFTSKGFYPRLQGFVEHAGSHARKFLGDPEKWTEALFEDYNKLKHDPAATIDPKRVALMARSARLLLECALLDHCSGSRAISKRMAADYRLRDWPIELLKIY